MRRGEFDNLKGYGKPMERDYHPMVDSLTANLNKMMINNGYVPEWVRLDKDIRYE